MWACPFLRTRREKEKEGGGGGGLKKKVYARKMEGELKRVGVREIDIAEKRCIDTINTYKEKHTDRDTQRQTERKTAIHLKIDSKMKR